MPIPLTHQQVDVRLWQTIRSRQRPLELLVVGAAGTGKTYGILHVLHVLARDNPGLRVLMARATRAAMTESVQVTYEQEILPVDGMEHIAAGVTRGGRKVYTYPSGSQIVLAGLDKPARIMSTAWDLIYINECIEVTEESWEMLLSRLGRPGRARRLGMLIGDTNPGDPSHWLRARVESGRLECWEVPHEANPALHDGVDWTEAGRDYIDRLSRTLTGARRRRLLHGEWSAGEGAWFSGFDRDLNVSEAAEYDPAQDVRLAIDCNGLHVAAVWWQERPGPVVAVIGDYLAVDLPAEQNARAIVRRSIELCGGTPSRIVADPAGKQRVGLNTTVWAEYERAGLRLIPWPTHAGSVAAGLDLVASLLPGPALIMHPRCKRLIAAMGQYMRARRGGQWVDAPEDPQHPHEDLIDALRGGLLDRWPSGRRPDVPTVRRVRPESVL